MYESNDKMVSHPSHYQSETGLEVIDVIEAFTFDLKGIEATDTGNIIKYACRWKNKNGIQDLKKIMWYTQHLIDHLEKKEKLKRRITDMKKEEIMKNVSTTFSKVSVKLKKHSPEILVVAGVVGTVASAVMACHATTKLDSVLEKSKKDIDAIHKCAENEELAAEYSKDDAKKDLTIVYVQAGVKVAKLYAPAVALGTLSIASIVASHNILKKRNVALAAAYATVDKTFKEYRNRVVERFGAEVDKELRYNIKAKKFEETVADPDSGKEKKVKSTVDVAAPSTNDYARFFDDTCEAYESNMDYNLMYLRSQQNLANDKLKANGYLFLSDVYDQLGIKRTKMSQTVGWIYKPEGNKNGDNFVDFGILETNRETEDGGYEKAILMEFNVDGPILDLI